jgi:hypothetical protein
MPNPAGALHVSNEKHKTETEKTLTAFGNCCLALCEVLHSDKPLNEMELLFIDNHIQVLHMAYYQWKKRHKSDG